jgi:hypothetical protein
MWSQNNENRTRLLLIAATSAACVQQRTIYGPDGRVTDRAITGSDGTTTEFGIERKLAGTVSRSSRTTKN